jgi:hypothetical protein
LNYLYTPVVNLKIQPVKLNPFIHREGEQIGIVFPKDEGINKKVRMIKGIKWSQSNGCWYLPLEKESFQKITSL